MNTGGYNCGICGAWIMHGQSHVCQSIQQPTTVTYTPPLDTQRLDRIIELLETILKRLENE